MKYTQARQLVEAALEILNEEVNVADQPHGTAVKTSQGWRAKRRKLGRHEDGGGQDEHEHFDSREDAKKWAAHGMSAPKFKAFVPKHLSAVHEMAQTNARYRQMGDEIERATVAYQEDKPGAERRLQRLLNRDAREATSGTLYGRGGKKIKNPKKHRDSRPLGEESEYLSEMAYSLDSAKVSRKKIVKADRKRKKAKRKLNTYFLPSDHPAEKEYRAELARHKEQGSSDTIYKHDPATDTFKAVDSLPKGSARKIVSQGDRTRHVSMSRKRVAAIRKAAKKHGGIVASPDHHDDSVDSRDQDTVVPAKHRPGNAITKPNRYARQWGRH